MAFYNHTKYVVTTPNPELLPLAVYEVVRGEFDELAHAQTLAAELVEMGECCEIASKHWAEVFTPLAWYVTDKEGE